MVAATPTFDELFAACVRSAAHLEMRDGYMRSDPVFIRWQEDGPAAFGDLDPEYFGWRDLVRATTRRGVQMRRARIVSEPISDYVRFEYDLTAEHNVAAGEQVRWLPRRRTSDLALPGNDFWVLDGRLVLFNHFDGNGEVVDHELSDDPAVVKLCASAFEAVWERATPHGDYHPA